MSTEVTSDLRNHKEEVLDPTEDAKQLIADYQYIKVYTNGGCEAEALRLLELATCRLLRVPPSSHHHPH